MRRPDRLFDNGREADLPYRQDRKGTVREMETLQSEGAEEC